YLLPKAMDIIHQLIAQNQGIAITVAEIVVFTVLVSLIGYHLMIYFGRRAFPEAKLYLYFSCLLAGFLFYIFVDTNLYFLTASQILDTNKWTLFFTSVSLSLVFFSFMRLAFILLDPQETSARILRTALNLYITSNIFWVLPAIPALTRYNTLFFDIFWTVTGLFILFQSVVYFGTYRKRQAHPEVKLIIIGVLSYLVYMWIYRLMLMNFPGELYLWMINNVLKIAMAFTFAYALARRFNREFRTLAMLKGNLEKRVEESTLELRKAKDEIENESQKRAEYFIQVAHETKTPLTLIGNYLHRVKKIQGSSAELNIIEENIDLLRETMVRFLDAEKFSKGIMVYNHQQLTCISDLLEINIPLFKDLAMQNQIEFQSAVTAALHVQADPLAIERIVNNLFDNALKFTPPYGTIRLTLTPADDNTIKLELSDTGKGMTKAVQSNIFRRYYQANPQSDNSGGLGMGLYIVKQTVDSLKGSISVDSHPEKGSVFTILLPLCKESSLAEAKTAASTTDVMKTVPDHTAGRKNVLIIEDNTAMLDYLTIELSEDYNVYIAQNGTEALRILDTTPPPDIILSDVMMKEMDGYEFYRNISTHPAFGLIPFIFITARSNQQEKLDYLNRGVSDYVYKPFSMDELKAKIQSVLINASGQRKAGLNDAIDAIHNRIAAPVAPNKWAIFESRIHAWELTDRQVEVIREVEKGADYKQIAETLNISQKTVHRHMQILFEKFSVHTKIDLLKKLFE
ncbi:MAG TPA: ATP-binding protein, partial [Bacteroidales bacterium]|nr:ATP-binding protein [Bacteroidales bacterium]